jgi:hypothetical protein
MTFASPLNHTPAPGRVPYWCGLAALAAALLLLPAMPARAAAEWHVAAGASGDGSAAAPFGRIQQALDLAHAGDTVLVHPGVYAESLVTRRAGEPGAPITIRTTQAPLSALVRSTGRVLRVSHAHVVVDGLILDGQFGAADAVRLESGAHHFVLRRSEVRRSGRDCIDMGGPNDVLLENSVIHHCLWWDGGRQDAHGVVAGPVRGLILRNLEIHTFSGDGLQLDPGRSLPGWDEILVENVHFRLAPLPQAVNGFAAGLVPGENAVDTKTHASAPRARLTLRNVTATGFGPGLISNMAAFNLKERVDVLVDGATVSLSEIAFRLRGPGTRGGAWVDMRNVVIHHVVTGVRYEDEIEKVAASHVTFGRNVARAFRAASSGWGGVSVRNSLFVDMPLPTEAPTGSGNRSVPATAVANASADDYRLHGTSPARDAGLPLAEITTDRDGLARPQGAGYDIGAYEYPITPAASFVLTATKNLTRPTSQVDLAWADVFSTEQGFTVERSDDGVLFSVVQTLKPNKVATKDSKLRSGRTYWYRVTALHADGSAPRSNVATVTLDLGRPLVPFDLSLTARRVDAGASVALSWAADPTGDEHYVIQRSLDGSKFGHLATVPSGQLSYTDASLARKTTYWYRVRAVNEVGKSAWTAAVSVQTP